MNDREFTSRIDERRADLDRLYKRAVRERGSKSALAKEVPKTFDSLTGLMNIATKALDMGEEKASYKDLGFNFTRRGDANIIVNKDADLAMVGKTLASHIRSDIEDFFDGRGKVAGRDGAVFYADDSKAFKGKVSDLKSKLDGLEGAL